ncbi:MSCRAMM family protein [Paludibaculum fermentans]|uniref:MSCRAMM family protein n=1 Tax=Paludibaculum fermentans TaxID=1473598 RepID=UPI003EBD059B
MPRFLFFRFILIGSVCANPFLFGQVSSDEKYTLSGSVANSISSEPIQRALVTLRPNPSERSREKNDLTSRQVLTDQSGAFSFTSLNAGSYRVTAQKPQFQTNRAADVVTLGPSRSNVALKLEPQSTVEGTVLDDSGLPIQGVSIQAVRAVVSEGRRTFRTDRTVTTDDRGRYRIWNLNPGSYYMRIAGRAGGTRSYLGDNAPLVEWPQAVAPIYQGRAADRSSATPLVVSPGQHLAVDFNEPLRPAFKVRGNLTNYEAHAKIVVQLLTPEGEPVSARISVNEANGRFQVNDVTPGVYRLTATQGVGETRLQGECEVRVSAGDVEGVELSLQRGIDLFVTQRCDAKKEPAEETPCFAAMELRLGDTSFHSGQDGSGQMVFRNLSPGRYTWKVQGFSGYVAAVSLGSEPLIPGSAIQLRAGLQPERVELLLRSDGASIQGEISQEIRKWTPGIVAVPDFESLTGPVEGHPTEDGKFLVPNLAPGNYTVFAVPRLRETAYLEPDVLRGFTNGFHVKVAPAGVAEVTITGVSQ